MTDEIADCSEEEFEDAYGDQPNDLTRPSEWTAEEKVSDLFQGCGLWIQEIDCGRWIHKFNS